MAENVWTIQELLKWSQDYLEKHGDEHARLSAQYLLSHATGLSRIELYAYFDRPLNEDERAILRATLKRRAQGEPLQYICGSAPFRLLSLKVTPAVLIPRPETELLVDFVLKALPKPQEGYQPLAFDVGVGSGSIALALATEREDVRVLASDISSEALDVARDNARDLKVEERVSLFQGSMAAPLFERVRVEEITHIDALVSNPPYIPALGMKSLPAEVGGFEPHVALAGGEDGLDYFRELLAQTEAFIIGGGDVAYFAVELDERNVEAAARMLESRGLFESVRVEHDLTRRPRFLIARGGHRD